MIKKRNRISENARAVAEEVRLKVSKGEKIVMGKIIKKHGYSDGISKQPIRVRKTQSYQKEIKPIVDRLIIERDRAIKALKRKISKAKYRDLTDAIDKLTKNIQLLSGGATSREIIELDEKKFRDIARREAGLSQKGGQK